MPTSPFNLSADSASTLSLVRRHELAFFFALVFLLTWPLQIIDALGSHGVLSFRIPFWMQLIIVAYMPSVAAVIVAVIAEGRAGLRELLCKLLMWRVGVRWYVFAIFGYAALCGGAIVLGNITSEGAPFPLLTDDLFKGSPLQWLIMLPVFFLIITLTNGEELAWRGFALPRLQARWNALNSSMILGVVWVAFHLPLFFTLTDSELNFMAMASKSLQLLGASVIFTFLYNHTRGSVLLAYLLHGAANTWTRVFPIDQAPAHIGWWLTALICITAVLIVAIFGAQHLKRNGQRVQHSPERK